MVASSPKGHIYFVSNSYVGSKNDMNVFQMPENRLDRRLSSNEWLMVDKGYKGDWKLNKRTIMPIFGSWADLTDKEQ